MLTQNDLKAIRIIVQEEVKIEVNPLKKQLDTLEMKVELVNKKVEQSQQETIETLSGLIHTGYNLHEERIKHIEDQLKTSQPQ